MTFFYKEKSDGYRTEEPKAFNMILVSSLVLLVIIVIVTAIRPMFNVWASGKAGEAELAQAEYNRQIIVRQAQAKLDASELDAKAEVVRAQGVQKANAIIADGLGGPEGYLRYLYINMLHNTDGKQVIYIPTEAGLPILEAGRR